MKKLLFIFVFLLSACSPDSETMSGVMTPEQVSLGFFRAIYVDRDVEKAKQFVDEPMKQVLSHYYIAASVQRHVLNLSMRDVTLEIEEIDIDFFRKFTKDVTVIVKMKGLKGGQPWIDDRTIRLHKVNNRWVIVEILPEKGNLN
ncbi:hypothetical protein L1D40_17890 [Shewanella insulae]|uniref:DUF4878 domain-containing protein n=1 Tax=Shewanella insulae TaxID=2681496 RepID=A0A6L7HXV9_9GAMM|nr:hypothetical protein [Shewanella insulae]MCG9714119.1 hypothetical protein [Shewanella insulae]MCG9757064.1 hypothetical protein [Shewanella insulae]MXR69116.1 hypothetical protein [Shewanella insulae]